MPPRAPAPLLDSVWTPRGRPPSRWERRPFAPASAELLERELGLTPFIARLFSARGLTTPAEVEAFLKPALAGLHDPMKLKGMAEAVDRIERAVERREPICIYGDYDVDGVTATALLKKTFDYLIERRVKAIDVSTHIPHRLTEGYGLQAASIRKLAERGIKLIITVDNGVTAVAEIELARELGLDVIVTDHHEPGPALPPAVAIVNPKQEGCGYPFKDLCGAGVAFKLAHALLKRLAPPGENGETKDFLKTLLDYVALGTVADVVSLSGENRALVSHGLKLLRPPSRPCFKAMFETMGTGGKVLEAGDLAYTIAPRLNAAGRTDHADLALDLLLCNDVKRARAMAADLEKLNETRRRIEGDITAEAMELVGESNDGPVIVLGQEGWHLGVIGIVASRVLDRYYRPVVALGVDGDTAKGSARSIRGFNIHHALTACSGMLDQYGGHAMAAGLKIRRESIGEFRQAINVYARSAMTEADLVPRLMIDAKVASEDLTLENAEAIASMEPFGSANARPTLELEGLMMIEEPRVMKERHLRLRLCAEDGRQISAVGFSMADRLAELNRAGHAPLRLAGAMTINNWGGQSRVEFEIKDFRAE